MFYFLFVWIMCDIELCICEVVGEMIDVIVVKGEVDMVWDFVWIYLVCIFMGFMGFFKEMFEEFFEWEWNIFYLGDFVKM